MGSAGTWWQVVRRVAGVETPAGSRSADVVGQGEIARGLLGVDYAWCGAPERAAAVEAIRAAGDLSRMHECKVSTLFFMSPVHCESRDPIGRAMSSEALRLHRTSLRCVKSWWYVELPR